MFVVNSMMNAPVVLPRQQPFTPQEPGRCRPDHEYNVISHQFLEHRGLTLCHETFFIRRMIVMLVVAAYDCALYHRQSCQNARRACNRKGVNTTAFESFKNSRRRKAAKCSRTSGRSVQRSSAGNALAGSAYWHIRKNLQKQSTNGSAEFSSIGHGQQIALACADMSGKKVTTPE